MNLYSRFYPIETLSTFQDQTTKSRDYQGRTNAYQLSVEIDSANSSGVTVTGSNQFNFNTAGEGYATVKVTATRPNTTEPISPIDQNWDVFIIQKDISAGYLRMPFTVHLPDELIEYTDGPFPIKLDVSVSLPPCRANAASPFVVNPVADDDAADKLPIVPVEVACRVI